MPYTPGKATAIDTSGDIDKLTDSVVNFAQYTEDELATIASALQDPLMTNPEFVVPVKPRRGQIAYADGTHWNPGAGEGLYFFGSDNAWHLVANATSGLTRHSFRVHLSANQSYTGGAAASKINFDTVDSDTANWWDNTNHQYKPLLAGYWRFYTTTFFGAVNQNNMAIGLYKNGSNTGLFNLAYSSNVVFGSISVEDLIAMNGSTDVVEVRASGNVNNVFTGGVGFTFFFGEWVRGL